MYIYRRRWRYLYTHFARGVYNSRRLHANSVCLARDVAITVRAEFSLNIFTYYLKMQNILLFIIAHKHFAGMDGSEFYYLCVRDGRRGSAWTDAKNEKKKKQEK